MSAIFVRVFRSHPERRPWDYEDQNGFETVAEAEHYAQARVPPSPRAWVVADRVVVACIDKPGVN